MPLTNPDNPYGPSNSLHGVVLSFEELEGQSPLDKQPTSQNYVYPTYYKFFINRLPRMSYTTTKVNLPAFGYDAAIEQDNRFVKIKHTANRVAFGNIEASFIVDEDMSNWIEIYDWIRSTAVLNDHYDFDPNVKDHYSDATLIITNSALNANVEVFYKNIFPISITGLEFDSSVTQLTPMTSIATFAFDYYTVKKL